MTRSLVLNPFLGYPEGDRNILDPLLEETIKEFSAIDGAFIIRGDGVILAAGVQLLPTQPAIVLPIGLGTRHTAAAATTASTPCGGRRNIAINRHCHGCFERGHSLPAFLGRPDGATFPVSGAGVSRTDRGGLADLIWHAEPCSVS